MKRRQLLQRLAFLGAGILGTQLFSKSGLAQAPGVVTSDRMRPQIPYGVASGDISLGQATIWSRSDRPARMIVEYGLDESLRNVNKVTGPAALETSNFTAQMNLTVSQRNLAGEVVYLTTLEPNFE